MKSERNSNRQEYLDAGTTALKEYERTGIAYAMKDVERYIRAVAAGQKPRRPKPIKRSP